MDRDGVVIAHLQSLLPDGKVLDIGAGDGHTAAQLTTEDRLVIPCEPAPKMIDAQKEFLWVTAVAQELPFRSCGFAGAYATWAYFFPGAGYGEDGLAEANRVVEPGGQIVVVDNAGDDEFSGLFERKIASDPVWWSNRGFNCEVVETEFRFDSVEEAERLLEFFWNFNGRRNGAEAKRIVEFRVAIYFGRSKGI